MVVLHLRNTGAPCRILGIVLNYGCFDLSNLPSVRLLDPDRPLVLSYEDVTHFIDAYLPGVSSEKRRQPEISPAYNNLDNLPPALFIVGTEDGLIDDTILMSGKWKVAGNEAVVKFIPGAPHGFMTFDGHEVAVAKQGWEIMLQFLVEKISSE
jgi:acetyl esterase/lipase